MQVSGHSLGGILAQTVGTACFVAVQIELNWLLDDAVAAHSSSTAEWRPCSWRHLQSVDYIPTRVARTPHPVDGKVALRLDLSSLTDLWKQRTQDRWVRLQSLGKFHFLVGQAVRLHVAEGQDRLCITPSIHAVTFRWVCGCKAPG